MKVLVTGASGQLGSDVMEQLIARGHTAVGADIDEMDISDRESVDQFITAVQPDAVIHCAAWTDVDLAEEFPEPCRRANATGTANVASVCAKLDCKLLYLSTDYVFGGGGEQPWKPDCCDFAPCNVYAQTKLEGEQAIRAAGVEKFFIVRIVWAFGENGKNFVKHMLDAARTTHTIRVVSDQVGTPTYTVDLARLLIDMIETDKYGYYHATNEGPYVSWYEYACEIYRQAGVDVQLVPVTTAEFGGKAPRPRNSRVDRSKLTECGFTPLPDWRDAVARFLQKSKAH